MKIVVFSDSHGRTQAMSRALHQELPDVLIHLGDGFSDLPADIGIPVYQVRGNCDSPACGLAESRLLELCGARLFLTHGHRYNVKFGLERLQWAALEAQAQLALFGHTHSALLELNRDAPSLMNPGSIAGCPGSYGVISLKAGQFSCKLKTV